MFRRVLITPYNAIVGQGNSFLPTTCGWVLELLAGRYRLKRVVLFGPYGLLGKDLLNKEGLEDCI